MTFRLTLLSASLALIFSGPTLAANPIKVLPSQDAQMVAPAGLVAQLNAQHGLPSDYDLQVAKVHPGATGNKVVRLNHTFKGVRIWQSESVVLIDTAGQFLSETVADRRQALLATSAKKQLSVIPALSADEAINKATDQLALRGSNIIDPSAELIIYPVMASVRVAGAANKAESDLNATDMEQVVSEYQLAYLVKTRMTVGGAPQLWDSIINAQDGSLLQRISAKYDAIGTGNSQYNGVVPIQTVFEGGNYLLKDASRGTGGTFGAMAITNADHGTTAGLIYSNPTNVWGDGLQYVEGGSTTGVNGQTAAVNAMWGLMNTYDTMKNVLGWRSLDGVNTATYIAAHVNSGYDNAYYSDTCKCMYIGDGTSFYSLGSVDVIGHEMGHGVTASTSNLTYAGESGGLNESNSDINGEMVEAYARNGGTGAIVPAGNDWFVGKEIARDGIPLRFMQKPSKDGASPNAWSNTISGLDVHYSSGPNNRMFYFLSQGSNATVGNDANSTYLTRMPKAMTGIGNDKAYRIWFKSNTTKFTASTNYADARAKVIQSAQELYGVGSAEEIAVKRAYAAINVGSDSDEIGYVSPVMVVGQPSNVAVTLGQTASFSVTADAGHAPYSYVWYKNGVKIRGASSATYAFATTAADANAKVMVRVTDSSTMPGTAASNAATLTVNPVGTVYERMVNGGFESGAVGWSGTTGDIGNWTAYGEPPYEGTKSAYLGGYGSAVTEFVYQTLAIPAAATTATLKFALHIDSDDAGTVANDKITVTVRNTAGALLGTLATYSNLNQAAGYQLHTVDVSAYKGQTVRIQFSETEDASLQTSFLLDSVSLKTD